VYHTLTDGITSLTEALAAAMAAHRPDCVTATLAAEHRVIAEQQRWAEQPGLKVTLLEDDRFLVPIHDFLAWTDGRKRLRMEDFYRWQRQQTGILMDSDQPLGGQWNYDTDNRKPLPKGLTPPDPPSFAPDAITRDIIAMVERRFPDHFGTTAHFGWPVNRAQALAALHHFITERLALFGDYQDALSDDHQTLFHSLLAPAINLGLLSPREVIDAAVAKLDDGAPLNAVEGFVRQILGWREYVRGIYHLAGPGYVHANHLGATRPLPRFYWTADSGMRCLDAAVAQTRDLAYAHHIQRLMVLGNFAMLAGVDPHAIHEWFLAVYADAYEWVEAPNVIGMSQFADNGLMASKPYAAGGAYINRMGDHCRRCRYRISAKSGPDACPFTYLYWDFLARNEDRLAANQRLWTVYSTWRRMAPERQATIRADAARFLAALD
jgi:deoxyribodipyrimidine photolyase-related protein